MRITSLTAKNILSFDPDGVELNFDSKLTVIVGPNGAGKSNIIRLVDLITKALDSADPASVGPEMWRAAGDVLTAFASARHHGTDAERRQVVRLGIEFTTGTERDLVLSFVQAAIYSTVLSQKLPEGVPGLAEWVVREVVEEKLQPLFRGSIVLEHEGSSSQRWTIGYDFGAVEGRSFRWVLSSLRPVSGILELDDGESPAPFQQLLSDRLSGIPHWETDDDGGSAHPFGPFRLVYLCPGIAAHIVEVQVQARPDAFDAERGPTRRFAELSGVTGSIQQSYSFAWVLRRVLGAGMSFVTEQLRGVGTFGAPPRPANTYLWSELRTPIPLREPFALPLQIGRAHV